MWAALARVAVIGFEMTWTGEIGVTGTNTKSDWKGSAEMRFDIDLGAIRCEHLVFGMTLPDGMTLNLDMKTELQQ